MLLLIRQLPDTLSTFESLRHWIYGPPATALNLELVNRLRDTDDNEAEFLLKSISQTNPDVSEYRQQLCSAKRELCPYTTITTEEGETYPVKALLDPGCTDSVISRNLVQREKIPTKQLSRSRTSYNADGSINVGGPTTEYVSLHLDVDGHPDFRHFFVTDLNYDMLIGFDWISHHNPEIDWSAEKITFSRCPETCQQENPRFPPIHFHQLFLRGVSMDLQREVNSAKAEKSLDDLPDWLQDYRDVFEPSSFDELPPHRLGFDHAIDLKPDAPAVSPQKVIPLPPAQQEAVRKFLDDNLATGRIRPSTSPYAAPFFFVPKQDGKERPVQDYRWLNSHTIRNKYPLPRIDDVLNRMRGSKVFSKLDVRWGFNNVRIKEGDEWKAAFLTKFGLFEPLVMFFGLCNSPATFQQLMDHVFQELIRKLVLEIYMDDSNLHHATIEEHRQDVRAFLEICRREKLFFRFDKCEFEVPQVAFLGTIISHNSVHMDPLKTAAIRTWPAPIKKKDLQSFLGFANYYRRFIRDFASIALPLNRLTGDVPWEWTPDCQDAFTAIKNRIASDEVLAMANDTGQYRVECDASYYATGSVLSQQQPDGTWRPIAFASWTMTPAQRNYQIYDKEFLAVINSLNEWRQYLLGTPETIEIFTDHRNLEYFRKPQNLSRRQADWVSQLSEYDFLLLHRPGRLHGKADFLSRPCVLDKGGDDNKNVIGIPERYWSPELDNSIPLQLSTLYIAEPIDRTAVIAQHHEGPLAGHPGIDKTIEAIQRHFHWDTLRTDVTEYVKGCTACQRNKPHRYKTKSPLHPVDPGDVPFANISVDLISPLPLSNNFDSILVFVDKTTKKAVFTPTLSTLTSLDYASLFVSHWVRHFGFPRTITSDRGPQFVSAFTRDFYTACGVLGTPSTAYHPQTDGQTERVNQELEIYLRFFVNSMHTDWDKWLPLAEYSYNDRTHSSTKISPHFALYGIHPWNGNPTILPDARAPAGPEFASAISTVREKAHSALLAAQDSAKFYYDRKKGVSWSFKIDDLVWLDTTNLTFEDGTKKLHAKRLGPFRIIDKHGPSSFELELPASWSRLHPVFNEALLTPFTPPSTPLQVADSTPPPPIIVDDEPEYEVEAIVGHKTMRKRKFYKVHWTGYPSCDDTWEPLANLDHAKAAIAEYEASLSPPRIRRHVHFSLPT